ncbi:hypothetical protein AB0M44_22085 [Streptosporangium subroseum]|uniref:hypothetical protein n=1 Tax=Streptosporangium subroseum TaxID=106412 RepID=UPI0034495875
MSKTNSPAGPSNSIRVRARGSRTLPERLEAHAAVTGDPALARRLEPQARAAVEWMFRDGGLGENGYLRYTSDAARGGLANP